MERKRAKKIPTSSKIFYICGEFTGSLRSSTDQENEKNFQLSSFLFIQFLFCWLVGCLVDSILSCREMDEKHH
jgi:hypothetical protein